MNYITNCKIKKMSLKAIMITISLLFFLPLLVKADAKEYNISLPQKIPGIEKIEYLVNDEPQGSTSGKNIISLAENSKLRFLIKFEEEGFDNLKAGNVKIVSNDNSILPLNIYEYDDLGNIITQKVLDEELINPYQMYVTSEKIILNDEDFKILGVSKDTYNITFNLENSNETILDAMDIKYQVEDGKIGNASFNEKNNRFEILNMEEGSYLKIWADLKSAYSQSDLNFSTNEVALRKASNIVYLPALRSDTDVKISGLEKNTYNLNFDSSNASFNSLEDNFSLNVVESITHGDDYYFKCDLISEDFEVVANNLAIRPTDGVYKLNSISENLNISVKNKQDAKYSISFKGLDGIANLTDLNGNILSNANVSYEEDFSFKISPLASYTQHENEILLYAVPEEIIDDSIDDFSQYLLTPSIKGEYLIKSITKPLKIIVRNAIKNTYKVVLPSKLVGANYEILENEGISIVSSNEALVMHDAPLSIKVNSEMGYDISDLRFKALNQDLKINKNENIYTILGITSSTDVIIDRIKEAKCQINFESQGFNCFDKENNIINSPALVNYGSEEFSFWLNPKGKSKSSEINVSLNGGNAKLKNPDENSKFYTVYDVNEDITIKIEEKEKKPVTLKLSSLGENLEFRANTETKEILPQENIIDPNSNFEFQVHLVSGESVENVNINSITGATISKISEKPLTYSVSEISENASISFSNVVSENPEAAQSNTEKKEYWCPAKYFEILSSPSEAFNVKFNNSIELNGPKNKTAKLTFKKNDAGIYDFNYNDIILECTSNKCNIEGGRKCVLDFYSDSEMKNSTGFLSDIGIEATDITDETTQGSNLDTYQMRLHLNKDFKHKDESSDIYENIGDDTVVHYKYETIYIVATPAMADNFKINLPNKEGVSFYKVANSAPVYDNQTGEFMGYEVVEGEKISGDVNFNVNWEEARWSFDFILKVEEGYDWNSLEVPEEDKGFVDLIKQNVVGSNNINLYRIEYSYIDNVVISINGLKRQKFNIDFSSSVGSTFHSGQGSFSIDDPQTVDYNETYEFYTTPSTGFLNEIKDILLIVNNKWYHLTLPDIESEEEVTLVKPEVTVNLKYEKDENENKNLKVSLSNIKGNLDIRIIRERKTYNIAFPKVEGISFRDLLTNEIVDPAKGIIRTYESSLSFVIEADETVDIEDIKVKANGTNVELTNNRYTIPKIDCDISIKVEGLKSSKNSIILTAYDGITYKNISGQVISENRLEIEYGKNFEFSVSLNEFTSDSKIKVKAEGMSTQNVLEVTRDPSTGRYIIENIKENYKITIDGIEINTVSIEFDKTEGINYYNQYGTEKLVSKDENNLGAIFQDVKYGENFSFRIIAEDGVDISSLQVWYKHSQTDKSPTMISNLDGVYTIENITGPYIIYTSNVEKLSYEVEIRTTEGVKCLDVHGNILNSKVSVVSGESLNFKLSIDNTYNKSTPIVEVKGSLNKLTPTADGIYILENITENKIIDIRNITKNTYKVSFKPAEGVIYKTVKNKPFTDFLDVEYGTALKFKISLMDAYDESIPYVLLNGHEAVAGSAGIYTVENINNDVEISVENVVKNPEELTIEEILSVPSSVSSSSDVDKVVNATKAYNMLSEEEQSLVTNLDELKNAQRQSESINHYSGDISVAGVDWNIKLIVTSLNEDKSAIDELNAEIERKTLLSLYEIKLYDTLTNTQYEVPYGKEIAVTMPCPDLSQYENVVVVHKNSGGGIEYLDVDIKNNIAQFKTSSFSRFGIAAKKIPNYLESPSDIKISVADLVENEDEIKSLLGEGVTSEIGELINIDEESKDDSDENNGVVSDSNSDENNSKDTTFGKLYNWAINNELLSVIVVLILGSVIIWLIIFLSRKKEEK